MDQPHVRPMGVPDLNAKPPRLEFYTARHPHPGFSDRIRWVLKDFDKKVLAVSGTSFATFPEAVKNWNRVKECIREGQIEGARIV